MNPIVKKNHMAVDCQGGDCDGFLSQYYLDNQPPCDKNNHGGVHAQQPISPTCQNGFGTIAPIPFCPIGWNVVTTVSVVTTLGDLVTIWFRGSKSCVMVAWRSPNCQKILLPCDEKSAWKINAKCSIFAVQNLGKKRGFFGSIMGVILGGFSCIYTLDDKWRI